MADLDNDGHTDLLSGSWPGELFLFRGGPGRTFAPPAMIKDSRGEIINIGGGIRERPGGGMLIAGNARFDKTSGGTFVTYHGKRLESTADKPIAITGTASALHAADWDGDGDLDLLVGDIRGSVYLVPNEGTAKAYAFGKERPLEAAGKRVHVGGDAGPFAADWDGDGDLDLLVGAADGSVAWFRNTGTPRAPALAAGEQLVPPGTITFGPDAPREPRRGTRSKVCTADWNGDGRLDLLVGDFATQKPHLPEPTPEQKAEHEKLRKEMDSLRPRRTALLGKLFGPAKVKDKDERDTIQKEFMALNKKVQDLRSRLPRDYDNHGWVWLFLRDKEK